LATDKLTSNQRN